MVRPPATRVVAGGTLPLEMIGRPLVALGAVGRASGLVVEGGLLPGFGVVARRTGPVVMVLGAV